MPREDVYSPYTLTIVPPNSATILFFSIGMIVVFLKPVGTSEWSRVEVKDVCEYFCQLILTGPEDRARTPSLPFVSHGFTLRKADLMSVSVTVSTGAPKTGGAGGIPSLTFCSKQVQKAEFIGEGHIAISTTAQKGTCSGCYYHTPTSWW